MGLINRRHSHIILGIIFMGIGLINRAYPLFFNNLIPDRFDEYREYISWALSIITIISGIGMFFKKTRRIVRWPLLTIIITAALGTLSQIFNLDVNVATNLLPPFWVKLKLPIQIGIAVWLWWATKDDTQPVNKKKRKIRN